MEIAEESYLAHYGILRRSGRYPWGSGNNNITRSMSFMDWLRNLRSQGLSEKEIATGVGLTTTQLRETISIANNQIKQADIAMAQRLRDKGMSNVAIGERMGKPESTVRSLLSEGQKDRVNVLTATTNLLKDQVAEKTYIDVGSGVETQLGISATKLNSALAFLTSEGYEVHKVKIQQLGTGKDTTVKVLAPPGTTQRDVFLNRADIKLIQGFSDDGGRNYIKPQPPLSINPDRVGVVYGKDGGALADGVIYVRPGVTDVSLGGANYAQVRIKVGDGHYLKGMAMYSKDLPDGVDLLFNTNKEDTGNKLDAMKPVTDDASNPFGAVVRQKTTKDANGKDVVTSAMNIVNEEGDWTKWSRNIASQVLSKQSPKLAKDQLAKTFDKKMEEFDEIMSLTNPSVKKKLLEEFADSADSSAVHLKAAALDRQASHIILPIKNLPENQVYAPNYENGESVVLIRFPHAGKFEIPELTVNNNHKEAKGALGQARDAIGINPKVAERLSGADFDGDTVLVIPNRDGKIKTSPALEGLKDFDPKRSYPKYEGMPKMTAQQLGREMGDISNLITDMTIRRATPDELARAVRHSMVVIDAKKHELNYKESASANGIPDLKRKYQGSANAGASTLISRAKSEARVPERKDRTQPLGGPINKKTGEKEYELTGRTFTDSKGRTVVRTTKSTKLAEAKDAHTLSSGTPIEKIYADHSNRLKELANRARLESTKVSTIKYSPIAKRTYENEVKTLDAKIKLAVSNRPLERNAMILANTLYSAKKQADPDMEKATEKKVKAIALETARNRLGAKKQRIEITPSEWDAIQSGAIAPSKLNDILRNADMDVVRELATPRRKLLMTSSNKQRAQAMLNGGATRAEVARALGVSLTTLDEGLK